MTLDDAHYSDTSSLISDNDFNSTFSSSKNLENILLSMPSNNNNHFTRNLTNFNVNTAQIENGNNSFINNSSERYVISLVL